jgi:hypothetical protein
MAIKSPTTNPIVIVGCQRSGTSLLRTILGNHPDLLEHPAEPQFLLGLYHRFGYHIRDKSEALAYVTSHPYLPPSTEPETLLAAFEGLNSLTIPNFAQRYLSVWGGNELKTKLPILKHPQLIFHLDLVLALFPDATIIHIVRDPRANVSSQRARWPQFSIWDCAMEWRIAVRTARNWGQQNKRCYHEIQYEHLIQNPQAPLKVLLLKLKIPYSEQMLSFEHETTMFLKGKPPEKVRFTATDPSRINLWQDRLSPLEIRRIEFCCKKEMLWWDYEPLCPNVSKGLFVSGILREWLYYQVKILGRKIKAAARQFGWRSGIVSKTPRG